MSEELVRLAAGEGEPPADPLRFEQALAAFRARVPMADDAFGALRATLKKKAFLIAGIAKLDLVTDVWRALDEALANGTTFEDFRKSIGAKLEAAWGRRNPSRLETIFRTNVQRSYGAGTVKMMRAEPVMRRRPFWKFSAIEDGRTTPTCQVSDHTVLPADSPFWATHQPPLHFNCRSRLIALTKAQADSSGVTEEPPNAPPAEGFGNVDEEWKPDLTKYPAPLVHEYQRKRSE